MSNSFSDLFKFISNLGKSRQHYASMDKTERSKYAPLVIMRWASGTRPVSTNELVNKYVFSLHSHPELLFELIGVTIRQGESNSRRERWLKRPKKTSSLILDVITSALKCSRTQASDVLPLLKPADIVTQAEELGWQKEQITKLKSQLREYAKATGKH